MTEEPKPERLDLADDATLDALIALQRASYRVEADLIGAATLPGLEQDASDLRVEDHAWLGIRDGDARIVAALSYFTQDGVLDISRVIVHPEAFRRGLASRLLRAVPDAPRTIVATATRNVPALRLYEQHGFVEERRWTVPGDIELVELAKAGGRGSGGPRLGSLPTLLVASLALAALSLLLPSSPTYDPWAWIIWGREISEGTLDTVEGPSWKPLPILFTVPFALLGDDVAPYGWLLIARAGGIFALGMTYRLGRRLAGPTAGVLAAVALLLADLYVSNAARGNSEGLLVGLCLLAVERHLDGRREHAFFLGVAAGLLRPEIWLFLGLYGLWLLVDPRTSARMRAAVVGSGVVLIAVWFVPEYLGSGDFLRASNRARDPEPESAAFAARPAWEVLRRSAGVLAPIVPLAALMTMAALAVRRRRGTDTDFATNLLPLLLGVTGLVLLAMVCLMTEVGYAGNLRYLALPAAFFCLLFGLGTVAAMRWVRSRTNRWAALAVAAVAALAVVAPAGGHGHVPDLTEDLGEIDREADLNEDMVRAVAVAGGRERMLACGNIYTSPYEVQTLAWLLHVPGERIDLFPVGPGTILKPRFNPEPRFDRRRFGETVGATRRFLIYRSCRPL